MKTVEPNKDLHRALQRHGYEVRSLFTIAGPDGSDVAWIEWLQLPANHAAVVTFTGGGWDVFTPNAEPDDDSIIADTITRACEADMLNWLTADQLMQRDDI